MPWELVMKVLHLNKVAKAKNRTDHDGRAETSEQGSSPHSLALHSQWRARGRVNTLPCPSYSQWRVPYSQWRVGADSTCIIIVFKPKNPHYKVSKAYGISSTHREPENNL